MTDEQVIGIRIRGITATAMSRWTNDRPSYTVVDPSAVILERMALRQSPAALMLTWSDLASRLGTEVEGSVAALQRLRRDLRETLPLTTAIIYLPVGTLVVGRVMHLITVEKLRCYHVKINDSVAGTWMTSTVLKLPDMQLRIFQVTGFANELTLSVKIDSLVASELLGSHAVPGLRVTLMRNTSSLRRHVSVYPAQTQLKVDEALNHPEVVLPDWSVLVDVSPGRAPGDADDLVQAILEEVRRVGGAVDCLRRLCVHSDALADLAAHLSAATTAADLDAIAQKVKFLEEDNSRLAKLPEGCVVYIPNGAPAKMHVYFTLTCWLALDRIRAAAWPTEDNHHRIQVADLSPRFDELMVPFALVHHKLTRAEPINLAPGQLVAILDSGVFLVRREIRGTGTYDGLDVPKENGDYDIVSLKNNSWLLFHRYFNADGKLKGVYVNLSLPVVVRPAGAEWVDLELDVIAWPDGFAQPIDQNLLAHHCASSSISPAVAERIRGLASRLCSRQIDLTDPACDAALFDEGTW
eukprot:gnl/Spiro4/4938_TR2462_c0_g1_i1.p1 gnl/Spiro4/4938_TR2462_c0_g1~~gnl/Spiro4/4938_TR2462_c0_g1_i1.p1  ORF type:complete len:524 (+),score=148.73 gnl/Spiro4/4938_TR2462_c0_g1_i1:264-1835(+)